jgi:hypothetical protein
LVARNIEQGFAPGHKNLHFVREEPEQYQQSACSLNAESPSEYKKAIEANDEFEKVRLDPRVSDRAMGIGTKAGPEEQAELLAFLDKNINVFTWSTSDHVGVSRDIIEHRLQGEPKREAQKIEALENV